MKTEQEISQAAIDWANDTDVTLDPEMTAIYAFIAGAQFASPKWIDIRIETPDHLEEVIIYTQDNYVLQAMYDCGYLFYKGDSDSWVATHWMPLPEPPTNDQKSEL